MTRTRVVSAERGAQLWRVHLEHADGTRETISARGLVNAGGPLGRAHHRRAARHRDPRAGAAVCAAAIIVTRRLFDHDNCYFFQGRDGRIIFAIPYERDFTLIGTTDQEHEGDPSQARCTPEEQD